MFDGLKTGKGQSNIRVLDKTLLFAILFAVVLSIGVFAFITVPRMNENSTLAAERDDLVLSEADLSSRLQNSTAGIPDEVSEQTRTLRAIRARLATFDTSFTPSSEPVVSNLNVEGVSYQFELLTENGDGSTSGELSPDDFYSSGAVIAVRYSLKATAPSLAELVAFTNAVNNAPTLLTLVNPSITYNAAAEDSSNDTPTTGLPTQPWTLTGELWVWGDEGD